MRILDISKFEDTLVLHFDAEGRRINAYTLASTLVAIADAAKAANASINAGYDVEVVVEALGDGSFRAKLRTIFTKARNLYSDLRVQAVVLSIIANFIYERTLSVDDSVKIVIQSDEVIIERGDERVIVPRIVYDATQKVSREPVFKQAIGRALDAVGNDDSIRGIGVVAELDSPPPEVMIPKSAILDAAFRSDDDPLTRIVEEQCDLQIIKAILDRTRRKWEFGWRGVKISAPVLDDDFYGRFFAHEITIAPGDILKVRLAIKQTIDPRTGIYTNVGYEVTEVYNHVAGIRQMPLAPPSDDDER